MQRKYLKINRKQFSLLEGMVVKHSFDGYIIICRDSRENEVLSPVLSIPILMQTYFTINQKKSNECKRVVKNHQILQCKASIRKIVLAGKTRKIVSFKRSFLQYES